MKDIGDVAPDFALQDQAGELVEMSNLLADGPLILYFYPIDFSPICTAQACAMRDRFDSATAGGIRIIGISAQSVSSHRRFADAHNIPFPLLADPKRTVIRAYGMEGFFGVGTRRATFLIGQNEVIENRVVSDLFLGAHTDFVNEIVRAQ
ncbi:MAG: redoxin domain-containing protein [Pseudomonadales bacterium]|nr:redoxin domain-containing protein [Pseudomonadales bacterium]